MKNTEKRCFILMPFDDELKEIYSEVYNPVCLANSLKCWRVDEIARPGSITRDIIEGILDADIIISDLTHRNPNVFYELGIAHVTGNKTIMTTQSLDDVPFDIKNYRIITYKQTLIGCGSLKKDLDLAIKDLLVALDRTNNPFQDVMASRITIGRAGKVSLSKMINFADMPNRITDWLLSKSIRYIEDFKNNYLEELADTQGIGRSSLSKLCAELMNSNSFPDKDFLHDFILKHRLDVTGKKTYW